MPLTPPLTKKVLGSPSQYPADLQSWMAKVISGNKLFQIDWPQLPGPRITSQAISSGPPKAPTDGDIWIATGVDANGTVWQFRYNAKSASAYKWEFIGGSKMAAVVAASESTTTLYTTYVDLTTVGPQVTVVRGGDYLIGFGCVGHNDTVNGGALMNVRSTSVGPVDASLTYTASPVTGGGVANQGALWKEVTLPGVVAGDTIKCVYAAVSAGTASFERRQILVQPVRVA